MAYMLAMCAASSGMCVYGLLKNIDTLAFVGLGLFAACMITAQILEDRFENRIKKLEKELKEMKSNDQRNTL